MSKKKTFRLLETVPLHLWEPSKPFPALAQQLPPEVNDDRLKNDTTTIHAVEFNASVIFLAEELDGSPCLKNGF
jgi:hypothetical protein